MTAPTGLPALWRSICDFFEWISRAIVGSSILAIVLITIVAVWYRYVLNAPLSWTEQVCRILFVWSVFAGAAVLYRQMLHIAIDMFVLMLPERLQSLLFWTNQALMFVIGAMTLWFGLEVAVGQLDQTYGALEITPASFYFAAPYLGALMLLFGIEKILDPEKRLPSGEVHL